MENPYKSPECIEVPDLWDHLTNNRHWDTFCDCFNGTVTMTTIVMVLWLILWLATGHVYWGMNITIWALGVMTLNVFTIVVHQFLG